MAKTTPITIRLPWDHKIFSLPKEKQRDRIIELLSLGQNFEQLIKILTVIGKDVEEIKNLISVNPFAITKNNNESELEHEAINDSRLKNSVNKFIDNI